MGAVFIFAPFRITAVWIKVLAPPSPLTTPERAKDKGWFTFLKRFTPQVLSIRPTLKAFASGWLPKSLPNTTVNGKSAFVQSKASTSAEKIAKQTPSDNIVVRQL